jgi:hypothetical protein
VTLQVGVAVKICWVPDGTDGAVGLTASEVNVATRGETVMIVEVPLVVPPSVALTKRPTVPAVVPAVKVFVEPLPLSGPRLVLERAQA